MKQYSYNGRTYQFRDKDVPKGAVPVETKQRATVKNKSRVAKNKGGARGTRNAATVERVAAPSGEQPDSGQ